MGYDLTMETDWFNVTALDHDIWRIDETYVNDASRGLMWLVRGRERQVLIDGGYGLAPLRPQVTLLQRRPTVAVATHTHYDHIGLTPAPPNRTLEDGEIIDSTLSSSRFVRSSLSTIS